MFANVEAESEFEILAPGTPLIYTLEITHQCNAACAACGNVTPHSAKYLTYQQFCSIIKKIAPGYLRISGGEPTLSPAFFNIIKKIQQLDIPFIIFTNGIWNNPDKIISLLKSCRQFEGFLLSLHGADAMTHDAFMGVTCFEKVIKNIKLAVKNGFDVHTNTVFSKHNINSYEKLTELIVGLGVQLAVFSRYYGLSIPETDLSDSELKSAIKQINKMAKKGLPVAFNNCIPRCFLKTDTHSCNAGFNFCTIDVDGNVRPCNHSSLSFGNIFEHSIKEIWASGEANQWRRLLPNVCLDCIYLNHCGGSCRAMQEYDINKIDPLIRGPIHKIPPAKVVYLPENGKPRAKYIARKEIWGYLLFYHQHSLPVSDDAKMLLDEINSQYTMSEIKSIYGMEMVELLAALFERGLIEFE